MNQSTFHSNSNVDKKIYLKSFLTLSLTMVLSLIFISLFLYLLRPFIKGLTLADQISINNTVHWSFLTVIGLTGIYKRKWPFFRNIFVHKRNLYYFFLFQSIVNALIFALLISTNIFLLQEFRIVSINYYISLTTRYLAFGSYFSSIIIFGKS